MRSTPLVPLYHEEILLYLLQNALEVLLFLFKITVKHAPEVNELFLNRYRSYIRTTHIDQQLQSSLVRFVFGLVVEIFLFVLLLTGGHFSIRKRKIAAFSE